MSSVWPWTIASVIACAYLVWRRLLAYLRYLQQEGYEAWRFLRWTHVRSLADPALWLSIAAAVLFLRAPVSATVTFGLGAVLFGIAQPDPRRTGKIPLRLTWRATRILAVAAILAAASWALLFRAGPPSATLAPLVASSVLFAGLPLVLIAANALLAPYEHRVQHRYEVEAAARLQAVGPLVIGITGSYGKSSTKAMLAHILQFDAPTLAASGSINTLMGVTRHIREELVSGHKFMIVEMGAFRPGSIRRLCQLTPPRAGLITAVGDMHLERFGSLDNIVKAKSELAQATPPGGYLAVNADSPGALRIARGATHCRVLLYGQTSTEDLVTRIEQLRFSKEGTTFALRTKERVYSCFTPLLGRPIILNLAGVFTMATALDVDPDLAVAAMRTLKPLTNRLEVVEEGGVTWVRDAYNSNQFGFRAALEVAAALPAARRFIATPGVIELGREQFEVNRTLAREAAAICDRTLVVSDTNKSAFQAGHKDAGRDDQLVPVSNRSAAFRWLRENVKNGDLVILENDLPDLYEESSGVFWRASKRATAEHR